MTAEAQGQAENTTERRRKERTGVVVSAKMQKTVVVAVERRFKHDTYGKYITRRKKFVTHDDFGCKEGDIVRIRETRPLSKTKRWAVCGKVAADGSAIKE